MLLTTAFVRALTKLLPLLSLVICLQGCGAGLDRYVLVDQSLRSGQVGRAVEILERAEPEYGSESRVLYRMDHGMILHVAGRYQTSNDLLDQAEDEVERLYTRRVRTEAKAFLINDSKLPYEGEPFEQTMINVLKALNYAAMGKWSEALVEARRIDHRLNVLADAVGNRDEYRDDAFARYLSGILYEAAGDLNNAFIAYRLAYEAYRSSSPWSRTPVPPTLQADLLRTSEALHLSEEHAQYRREFGDVAWQSYAETQHLAQVVMISLNGRAPRKEDQFIDMPISLDALNLVLLSKAVGTSTSQEQRAVESVLYGLNGHVVRVALPTLVRQKSQVAYAELNATGPNGSSTARTELVHNLTAVAEKSLASRLKGIAIKAVARAAVKFALADGVGRGAHAAAGNDAGPLVGFLVGAIAKTLAVASEEADKRSWRTLPDEIQLARMWLPPGEYRLRLESKGRSGGMIGSQAVRTIWVRAGQTYLFTERIIQ